MSKRYSLGVTAPAIQHLLDRGKAYQLQMHPRNNLRISVSVWFKDRDESLAVLSSLEGSNLIRFATVTHHTPWIPNRPRLMLAHVSN